MNVKFCGAAGTVTGSCHLLTLDDGTQILLDCGLYQGRDEEMIEFNKNWYFDPKTIDVVLLSHAHIDHSGRLPRLVKDGFEGPIVCTSATRDLCAIMLMDSAGIQERDAEWLNKKAGRWSHGVAKPLYTKRDVSRCMNQFIGMGYDRWYPLLPHVDVLFRDAGHILGSASVTIRVKNEDGSTKKVIGFTGDIGRPDRPILKDPHPMPACDALICESTYGYKEHEARTDQDERFLRIIQETCVEKKGKLIIPAFSIGRTQELVHTLDTLETYGKLPKIKVYVDSPLAINATRIFGQHPECFDEEILEYMLFDENPFGFSDLIYTRKVQASKMINHSDEPCIIISASGMASSGRIRHHIYNNIEQEKNTIMIVGYCAPNTLGGHLARGAKQVRIFNQEKEVRCRVERMNAFSAHGDRKEMLDFLQNQDPDRLEKLFLVHGERDKQEKFQEYLSNAGFSGVFIPHLGESFKL